jgi:RES domain-containing protein
VSFLTLSRGDENYFRVAKPEWENPLDTSYAHRQGGRWNPPLSFPVLYLNATIEVAKANVHHLHFHGAPWDPEDIRPGAGPVLAEASVPEDRYVDVVTPEGIERGGLPPGYPKRADYVECQAVGQRAWDQDHPGIACLSAAPGTPAEGEELAWFDRGITRPVLVATKVFEQWYFEVPSSDQTTPARRLEERQADPYADLDAYLLEHDDGGVELVREQRDAGIPAWSYDGDGNLVST